MEKEERKEISFKKEEDMGNKGWVTDGVNEARKVVMNTAELELTKLLSATLYPSCAYSINAFRLVVN